MTNIPTEFPLSHRNYTAKVFAELHNIPIDRIHYYRKTRDKNFFWVCCVENEFVRGYKINEERYLIWLEGGKKVQALIKYLKNQEKEHA